MSETRTGPSPESTKRPGLLDEGVRRAYEKTAKTVAKAASALIEGRLGGGTGGFLMEQNEAQDIAEPASRLAARHAPMPGGSSKATDLSDVVELVVAVFGYLMNGLTRRTSVLTRGGPNTKDPRDEYHSPVDDDPPPPAITSWPGTTRSPEVGIGG
jgi:hypothetical protein